MRRWMPLVSAGVVVAFVAFVAGVSGSAGSGQARWVITDLGTLGGGYSRANAVNERGQVVGASYTKRGLLHAFLWQHGKIVDLGTLGGLKSEALALNGRSQVVGWSSTSAGRQHAVLWENGKLVDLGKSGMLVSRAVAINESGQAIGGRMIRGSNYEQNSALRALLWQHGKEVALGTLGGKGSFVAAINNLGQIVGDSRVRDGWWHAFLWQAGSMTDLGVRPPGRESGAYAINWHGQVVGWSATASGDHAVLVRQTGRRSTSRTDRRR